jgi:hypothetical protein
VILGTQPRSILVIADDEKVIEARQVGLFQANNCAYLAASRRPFMYGKSAFRSSRALHRPFLIDWAFPIRAILPPVLTQATITVVEISIAVNWPLGRKRGSRLDSRNYIYEPSGVSVH